MSAAICLTAARTIMYPHGGGHLWVYLQWALSLLALGCRVIWLEALNPRDPKDDTRELVTTLKERLKPFGLADRSEEHTSELQSHHDLVCRLLLEKKKH